MKLSRTFAKRFCELLSQSDQPLTVLVKANPEFPSTKKLYYWREKAPWFASMWRRAREEQGEHLVQKCLELAHNTTPQNAHAQRVRFDIYWKIAGKFHPSVYGDKPAGSPQTNIAVGVTISAERLNEIRSKLDLTRTALNARTTPQINRIKDASNHNGQT